MQSFIEVWFLAQWEHIRQASKGAGVTLCKESWALRCVRVRKGTCVAVCAQASPLAIIILWARGHQSQRGFDKQPIPFPLQAGPAPKISFQMVRSHLEDEGYSCVIVSLPLCPRYTWWDCNGEVRWVLRIKETSKLTVCEAVRFDPLQALEGFSIASKIHASSTVMEATGWDGDAGECACVAEELGG